AMAQDNAPPTIEIVKWTVNRQGVSFAVYDRDGGIGDPNSPDEFLHEEGDFITAQLEIIDVDWQNDPNQPFDPNNPTNSDPVFVRIWGQDTPFCCPVFDSPSPPPIPELDPNFIPQEGEGFGPNTDLGSLQPRLLLNAFLDVPQFTGVSQARLTGLT